MTTTATLTHEQVTSAIQIVAAIGDAIRELGSVPSGELYVRLMDKLSLSQYESCISMLKRTGLVTESAHLLTWAGPKQ